MSARQPGPEPPLFHRLLPEPATVTAAELLDTLEPIGRARPDRPYTIVNFVAGLDGRVAVEGRSAPLSDSGDRAMFHELRERVDAVLAGTRTMGLENYGRLVRDPARRARRATRGLAPDPLACLITRSGEIPIEIPLFADSHSRVVVFTPHPLSLPPSAATVETVLVDPGALTLTTAMRRLRIDHDVRALLCEGGPTLFAGLLSEGLVDELFLTVSPRLTGGAELTITSGPALRPPVELELAWAVEREGTMFLRYRRG